jgi:Cu/Ag efflux pump CusA
MSDQRVDVNSGEIWVSVDPAADYAATVAAIDDTVGRNPDVSTEVLTYSDQRVTEVLQRSRDDVVVRIYGEDAKVRSEKADEVRSLIAEVDGVAAVNVGSAPVQPTMEVEVDLARAQRYGVKPGDVRRAAASLLAGITVGHLFQEQKVFDVVVWGAPDIRQSERDIEQLLIDTPNGGHVRLGEVADVRSVPNTAVIRRESVSTYVDVTADVAGRDVGAVASEIDGLLEQVSFPLEHHAELLGGYTERTTDTQRLITVALAAGIAIVLLLQAAFRSWRLAVLSFLILPLALSGGVVAAFLAGGTITLGSIAGFVGVLGIAARGLVMQVRHYQRLERTEGGEFGPELVLRATREDLVPMLLSTLATAAVLAPIAVMGPVPGFEIVHPMVIAVLGGLVTTTVVNLLIVPVLYLRYGFGRQPDTWTDELFEPIPETELARG